MANYFGSATSGIQVASNFDANFTHCIIDGSNEDEIEIDSIGFHHLNLSMFSKIH